MTYKPKFPVFDAHVHISGQYGDLNLFLDDCARLYKETGIEGYASQCTSSYKNKCGQAAAQMLAKYLNPGRVYAYGGFVYHLEGQPSDRAGMLAQIKDIYDVGFDGLKMLEGKPTTRKETGVPLDSDIYDDAFDFLEKTGMHVVYHVADPWTFWDKDKCPPSAYDAGWAYVDGTYAAKEQLHGEIDRMLAKHPRLNVTFAHFYYLAHDLVRLSDFLDRNPYVSIDICPGSPNFYDFQANLANTCDFFIKYRDRILFGTDNVVNDDSTGAEVAIRANRGYADLFRFLELPGEFTPNRWKGPMRGLGLDDTSLKKIYKDNFTRLQGGERSLDVAKATEYCERRLDVIEKNDVCSDGAKKQIRDVVERFKHM